MQAEAALAPARRRENAFVVSFGLSLIAAALIAFSYNLDPATRNPNVFAPLFVFHGLSCMAWLVLLVVQAMLVRRSAVSTHVRLGLIGALVAALVVGTSTLISVLDSTEAGAVGWQTQGNLASVWCFGGFVLLAIRHRSDRPKHRRFMLTGTVFMLSVVASRLGGTLGPLGFFGFYLYVWIALLSFDRRANGGVFPASWVCFGLTFVHVVWVTAHVIADGR